MKDLQDLKFKRSMFLPVLPLVYDDALSYIEQLGRITKKINEVIESMGSMELEVLAQANAYTDQQITLRLSNVEDIVNEVKILAEELDIEYNEFKASVNKTVGELETEIDGFNAQLIASVNAVNERTDMVVAQNNEALLREMQRYLSNILVTNYITGEEISIQDMFDYLCLFHLDNPITYTELNAKQNTYTQLAAYQMTYTDLIVNGKTIIQ